MNIIFDGILLGLTLSILLGPIFVAITQTVIEHGAKAGISVGTGIWTSDVLVILFTYLFISEIGKIIDNHHFQYWMGLAGGLALILIGVLTLIKKNNLPSETAPFNAKSYFGYYTKGFIVNFFNPFTFVFWISTISSYLIVKQVSHGESVLLVTCIMVVIVTTDTLKVFLAKWIKTVMSIKYIHYISKIAGLLLIVFGFILLNRSNVVSF